MSFLLCYHCTTTVGETDPVATHLDRTRGCVIIQEINWAGSVRFDGQYDPDDDFIELNNRDCNKPVDLTGWMLKMKGDIERTYTIPAGPYNIVGPNEIAVLIAKDNLAFRANIALNYFPIFVPGMYFPDRNFTIETKTAEDFLIENAVNTLESEPLGGGYDGFTTRSMERTENKFDEEGTSITTWHSMTPCNENFPSSGIELLGTGCSLTGTINNQIGQSGKFVDVNYRDRTYATPGEVNTVEYQ